MCWIQNFFALGISISPLQANIGNVRGDRFGSNKCSMIKYFIGLVVIGEIAERVILGLRSYFSGFERQIHKRRSGGLLLEVS